VSTQATVEPVKLLEKRQLEILQHALGLDQYGQGKPYRNHFCAGDKDEAACQKLVALGYMDQRPTTEIFPYFNCVVTEAGKEAVRRESPAPPKLTRSQKNYRAFLSADCGMTFFDWLKRGRPHDILRRSQ
jgi:hypothetical protein